MEKKSSRRLLKYRLQGEHGERPTAVARARSLVKEHGALTDVRVECQVCGYLSPPATYVGAMMNMFVHGLKEGCHESWNPEVKNSLLIDLSED